MTKVPLPEDDYPENYATDPGDALHLHPNSVLAYGDARAEEAREDMRAEVEALRKPLTSQQLDALIEAHVGGSELTDSEYSSMVMFAAVVERAHGIDAAMAKGQK